MCGTGGEDEDFPVEASLSQAKIGLRSIVPHLSTKRFLPSFLQIHKKQANHHLQTSTFLQLALLQTAQHKDLQHSCRLPPRNGKELPLQEYGIKEEDGGNDQPDQ